MKNASEDSNVRAIVDCSYKPKNIIAKYVDDYGEERIIHRPKGPKSRQIRVANTSDSPVLQLNRAATILIGRNIRKRRTELGMSQKRLCQLAGFSNVNPKQYIYAIEAATRQHGCRIGSLFAISHALSCEVSDLLPLREEVINLSGVEVNKITAIQAA